VEQDIEAAFAAGATGVMSDYPTLLSNYIRRCKQATWSKAQSLPLSSQTL